MITIKDYTTATVADYLRTGKYRTALIKFHHGLGDAIMFWPSFRALCEAFPTVLLELETHLGQQEIYGTPTRSDYDICFILPFPAVEWRTGEPRTKREYSAETELGITVPEEDYRPPVRPASPFVGTHFFSTCCRGLSCPENFARQLTEKIQAAGFIALDTHMAHQTANPANRPYDWQQVRLYEQPATCGRLFGAIACCSGFVGVTSGNLWAALAILPPEKILYIETEFPVTRLTRLSVFSTKAQQPDWTTVQTWLENLNRKNQTKQ